MKPSIKYTSSPDSTPPTIGPHLSPPPTGELTEADFSSKLESVKRQHRGVKLAIAQAELDKDRIVLQQKHIEIGIAQINLESTKQDFLSAAYKLVEKRARTSISSDNAQSAIAEWSLNQDSIKEKVQGLYISVKEAQLKNEDKKDDLQLKGMPARMLR